MLPRPHKPQTWAQHLLHAVFSPPCAGRRAGSRAGACWTAGGRGGPVPARCPHCRHLCHGLAGTKIHASGRYTSLHVWTLGSLGVDDSADVSYRVTKVSWARGSLGRKLMGSQTPLLSTGRPSRLWESQPGSSVCHQGECSCARVPGCMCPRARVPGCVCPRVRVTGCVCPCAHVTR